MDIGQQLSKKPIIQSSTPSANPEDCHSTQESYGEITAHFHEVFAHVAIGTALITLGNRWLRVNHSLCELLGYSEPEMLALTFSYVTHPHDLDNDLIQRQQLLAGEISNYQVEKRYRHKQGHDIWCLLSVTLAQQIGPD
ncbi:MAG: PAS domain S-box protein, partial [Nodosilinea sp.]